MIIVFTQIYGIGLHTTSVRSIRPSTHSYKDMPMEGEHWRQIDQLQWQLDLVNVERLMVEVMIYATTAALETSSEGTAIRTTAALEPLRTCLHDHRCLWPLAPRPDPTTD